MQIINANDTVSTAELMLRKGEIFGDNVIAAALLDRLLHHAIVVEIEGHSYRLREHAELVPESMKGRRQESETLPTKRRGRPRKSADEHDY